MRKIYLSLIFLASFAVAGMAQLANGSTAPNFTITDQEGTEHTLQDYLDAGKTVVIDLFATWCGPCWTIHQNHVLENLYNVYGPDGTDEVMVFGVEVDASTTHNDLIGTGGNTIGNWLEGISYPMAEHNTLASMFSLAYYPTIFAIRPSGKVILINDYCWDNIADPEFDYVYDIISRGENDVIVRSNNVDITFCKEFLFTGSAAIFNAGTNEVTSLQVDMLVNGEVKQTKMYNGTLGEFRRATVNFSPMLIEEASEVSYVGTKPNSVDDSHPGDNTGGFNAFQNAASTVVTFTIHTDFWPEEISWEFQDEFGTVVASSSELGSLSCDETYVQEVELDADGCYKLVLEDGFGDGLLNGPVNPSSHSCGTENGMNNNAMGAISLALDGVVVYDNISYGGGTTIDFAWEESSATHEIAGLNGLNVYPNPTSDYLQIAFDLAEATRMNVEVVDLLGRRVIDLGTRTFQSGTNNEQINTLDLANGMYLLRMTQGNAVNTKKFNVVH